LNIRHNISVASAIQNYQSCRHPQKITKLYNIFTSPMEADVKCSDEYVYLSVCLTVHKDISGTTYTIFTKCFVHVAYVRGLVLLWHVDDRPHRLLAGRG